MLYGFVPVLPTWTEISASASPYATGFFNDMWPLVIFGVGIIVGAILLTFIAHTIVDAIKGFAHRKDKFE